MQEEYNINTAVHYSGGRTSIQMTWQMMLNNEDGITRDNASGGDVDGRHIYLTFWKSVTNAQWSLATMVCLTLYQCVWFIKNNYVSRFYYILWVWGLYTPTIINDVLTC